MRAAQSIAASVGCLAWIGCATPDAAPPRSLAAALDAPAAAAPDALVVRLAFDAAADLDLYVTDPQQETVYFANTPARSGGALDADRTCADAAPRVETVVFEAPLPGRYRVGVDHPASCGRDAGAAFALRADRGAAGWRAEGRIAPRSFEPIVLELVVD
jgi:hypothetical protein